MGQAAFLSLLLAALASVDAQDVYGLIGGELTLALEPQPPAIERVVWKHGANLVADGIQGKFTSYKPFKTNVNLNENGALIIRDIRPVHAGLFTVEVNNQVQTRQYNVLVISRVSKPTVRLTPLTCSHTSPSCTLVCSVTTEGAGTVSYRWLFGPEPSDRTGERLEIEPSDNLPPTYTCRVNNELSEADSDPVKNPLIAPPSSSKGWIAAVVVVVLLIVLAVVGWWKKDTIKKMCNRGNTPNGDAPGRETSPDSQPLQPKPETATVSETNKVNETNKDNDTIKDNDTNPPV